MALRTQYGGDVAEAATKQLKLERGFGKTYTRIIMASQDSISPPSSSSAGAKRPLAGTPTTTLSSSDSNMDSIGLPSVVRLFHRPSQALFAAHGMDAVFLARKYMGSERVLNFWAGEEFKDFTGESGSFASQAAADKRPRLGIHDQSTSLSGSANSSPAAGLQQSGLPYLSLREGREVTDIISFILFQQRVRLEIYVPASDGESSSSLSHVSSSASKGSFGGWRLQRSATPGNYESVEDLLGLDDFVRESPIVMAIQMGRSIHGDSGTAVENSILGVAFVDLVALTLNVCEIVDSGQLAALESLLVQVGPKEVIIPATPADTVKRLRSTITDRCGIPCTERQVRSFSRKTEDVISDCEKLCTAQAQARAASISSFTVAWGSCAALFDFLELLAGDANLKHFTLSEFSIRGHMRLDAAAVEALHVLPSSSIESQRSHLSIPPANPAYRVYDVNEEGSAKPTFLAKNNSSSLYSLLNYCSTFMGKRRLAQWLRQPLLELTAIQKRQALVAFFVEPQSTKTALRRELMQRLRRNVPDVEKQLKKLLRLGNREVFRDGAGVRECFFLHRFVQSINPIIADITTFLDESSDRSEEAAVLRSEVLDPLIGFSEHLQKFSDMAESTVDMEAAENQDFVVVASFEATLQELADFKSRLYAEFSRHCETICDDLRLKDRVLSTDFAKRVGLYLRLPKTAYKDLFNSSKYHPLVGAGFADTENTKGKAWRFTTDVVDNINVKWLQIVQEYEARQSDIVSVLVEVASTYVEPFAAASALISDLDCVLSLAEAAAAHGFVRPIVLPRASDPSWRLENPPAEQPVIELLQARHPCLSAQDDCDFVPNDVVLLHDSSRFVLVTGPNMGGKSTYIRTVGVCCLLAQIGCFVPCAEARMCIVDGVFCRVGASDSQLRGISTFMAEMLEMAGVLQSASSDSLLIVDELGRGTSTYDGFGLAWAISEHICNSIGCWALFATHFHELTQLEHSIDFVANLHVDAHIEANELVLLHQIREGPSLQSFGIHVAELANFPSDVIRSAQAKLAELENESACTQDVVNGVSGATTTLLAPEIIRDRMTAVKTLQAFFRGLKSQLDGQANGIDDLDDLSVVNLIKESREALGANNVQLAIRYLKGELH